MLDWERGYMSLLTPFFVESDYINDVIMASGKDVGLHLHLGCCIAPTPVCVDDTIPLLNVVTPSA